MSEQTPEPVDTTPAVEVLRARREVLIGGEASIGVREQRVEEMRAALASEEAALTACCTELAALDAAITLLTPPVAEG